MTLFKVWTIRLMRLRDDAYSRRTKFTLVYVESWKIIGTFVWKMIRRKICVEAIVISHH